MSRSVASATPPPPEATHSTASQSRLFPIPAYPNRSRLIPAPIPGRTHQSTDALRSALIENHYKFHCFFNNLSFHNHTAHDLLAKYWLGAGPDAIRLSFERDKATQRLAFRSPSEITEATVFDHLGDERYYDAYRNFFTERVLSEGTAPILEQYIFSSKANRALSSSQKDPLSLCRFFGGLLHPLIHTGYGCEFNIPGMIIEGLAQSSVHTAAPAVLLPRGFFEDLQSRTSPSSSTSANSAHTFMVLARICNDPRFNNIRNTHPEGMFYPTATKYGSVISEYSSMWSLDLNKPDELERKLEELSYLAVLLYAIAGSQKQRPFDADFFLMHLVNSSLFLPSLCAYLSKNSQEILLRCYLSFTLAWWISRGRPVPDINHFYTNPFLTTTSTAAQQGNHANPWFPYFNAAINHPDNHFCKLQRTLAHYSSLYGNRLAGQADFSDSELDGAKLLDGTLFLRAAVMTHQVVLQKEAFPEEEIWGRQGFFSTED